MENGEKKHAKLIKEEEISLKIRVRKVRGKCIF